MLLMVNKSLIKRKKEVGMKKVIIVALALFLAIPAISYAGSATSRWDVVIGGNVKLDMGYNTQNVGSSANNANVQGMGGNQNAADKYGNFFMGAGETSLNFLIKGPDAWGAKTMAFIQGDFTGNWSGTNYGTFDLAFAFIKLDWKNTSLTMGQMPTIVTVPPTWSGNTLDFTAMTPFNKGTPPSMNLMVQQRFAKDWAVQFGLISGGAVQGNAVGQTGTTTYGNSKMPDFAGDITYSSDACGKVGPWKLLFSAGGFWGKEKRTYIDQAATATTSQTYGDKDVNSWLFEAKAIIPIIPEKKQNKAGALFTALNFFTAQNPGLNLNMGPVTYQRGNLTSGVDFTAPVISGGFAHIAYYLTDKVWVNGFYGYYRLDWSNDRNRTLVTNVQNQQQTIANIMYDASPALRVGFEYGNFNTRYGYYTALGGGQYYDTKGTNHMFRVGAFYFF
jgi:hypothetical protein